MAIGLIPVCTLLKLDFGDNIGSENTWVLNEVTTESFVHILALLVLLVNVYINRYIFCRVSHFLEVTGLKITIKSGIRIVFFLDQTQTLKYRNQNYLTYDKKIQNSTVYSFFSRILVSKACHLWRILRS